MILSWSTIQFSEKPQTLYLYWTLSMSLQIIPLHMYSVCPHSFRYGGRYTLEILKGAFVWEYSGIRIYSGIGKFSFAKRTNIRLIFWLFWCACCLIPEKVSGCFGRLATLATKIAGSDDWRVNQLISLRAERKKWCLIFFFKPQRIMLGRVRRHTRCY